MPNYEENLLKDDGVLTKQQLNLIRKLFSKNKSIEGK